MGYLKRTDMLYSQAISMVALNIITYFQISAIGRDFMKVFSYVYNDGYRFNNYCTVDSR